MRYEEFHFKNFKGIDDLRLSLTGDVTTLIGLNESGKTTILEAIFCFSYGAENLDALNPGMVSLRDPEQWIPISLRANFNDQIAITAVVSLSELDQEQYVRHLRVAYGLQGVKAPEQVTIQEVYHFENSRYNPALTQKLWSGLNLAGTKGQQRNPRSYRAASREWQGAVAFLKDRLPKIWYFPNFLFELPDKFMLVDDLAAAGEEQDKNRFYRSTFEQVLGRLGTGAELQTHVVQRLESVDKTDARNLKSLLLDMSRVISGTILEGWNRIFANSPAGQEVEIDADRTASGEPYLELKIRGADGYYDLSERSLGFRWFFMFLLMTSYHGVRAADGSRSLFLLDEPASNLHSSAQAELLKSFENLSKDCHLVYTTHSHHMINVRWLDAAFVVKNDALGTLSFEDYVNTRMGARTAISATRYRRFVAQHPGETSYFQPVLDLLEYRPSGLEPVPSVTLVEGKSDFYLLRYVVDVLGLPSDLKFVPGGGAGSLDPLIRLHIGWGKSFVVLLDGDAEGRKQKGRYEKEFGPVLADHCHLLPDLCGDAKAHEIEDLLTADDRRAVVAAVYGSVGRITKKLLLQSILELFARKEPVALEAETLERLRNLLAELEAILATQ